MMNVNSTQVQFQDQKSYTPIEKTDGWEPFFNQFSSPVSSEIKAQIKKHVLEQTMHMIKEQLRRSRENLRKMRQNL